MIKTNQVMGYYLTPVNICDIFEITTLKVSGIVIDSFVYAAIKNWRWTPPEESSSAAEPGEYEKLLYDYYLYNLRFSNTINAPGSNDYVDVSSSKDCLEKVLLKMCK